MDPLSITSALVALAAAVYKCTIADATDSLSDLAEEAQLIQGALQVVDDALRTIMSLTLTTNLSKRSHELPRRELDTPAQESNVIIIKPVEDLIDLSCEPSEQATLMPPFIRPQSTDLIGLQFMPIASDDEVDSPSRLDVSQAAEPMNTRGITGYLRESSLPPEVHPAVAEASRIVLASDMVSDELLDGSPMGSSQAPNIEEFGLQKSLVDLEAKHGHAQRRRASPRGSAEISDEMRKGSVTTKTKHGQKITLQSQTKRPQQKHRFHKVNPGTPPDEKGPMLLKTVEDAIQRLIVPELNAKNEKAQLGRRFTGAEVSRYMSSC
ncbi:hypothetical protein CEK26_009080 [Fusarium fujikuroi]|uniref:Uncharacterized protein n=1 Tax=Fusarium fujikuroi TaxID=5127 RepID=A0A5Q3FYM8_FUSFU|nr:hypothetical protein CEK27_009098 [Fusarium fujikuroi]QGI96011.1 hypothetical protein CEK26_009080 [Fusarium fujikuroi]VTT68132.1 unnamed protein product [Fusarium fujikuroi]